MNLLACYKQNVRDTFVPLPLRLELPTEAFLFYFF